MFITMYNTAWLKNYSQLFLTYPDGHLSLLPKGGPAKTRYEDPLRELIELVSSKDPYCRQGNSTSDPYWKLDNSTFTPFAKLLLAYRQQHIRWRKLLLEGKVKKIRTLTWYCDSGCAGLGDRVRGIGFSLMLAIISNRLFLIQWRQPFEVERQNNIFEPAAIDWNLDQALADKFSKLSTESVHLGSGSSREERVSHIKEYIISTEYRHVRIKTNIHFNNIVNLQLSQIFDNRIPQKQRFQIIVNVANGMEIPRSIQGVLVHYLLKFSPPVLEKVQELFKEMHMSYTQHYVVANIRSGFLGTLNEFKRSRNMAATAHRWEGIIDPAVKKNNQLGTNVPVVLCTDSDKVKSWAREHYNGTVVSIPRRPIHVGRIFKDVVNKSNAEIETVAEVAIMSRASFLFKTSGTGFTSVACQMCPFVISSIP